MNHHPSVMIALHVLKVWEENHDNDPRLRNLLARLDEMTPDELEQADTEARALARSAGSTGAACAAESAAAAIADYRNPGEGNDDLAARMARWASAWGACGDDPRHVDRRHLWGKAWTSERHWQDTRQPMSDPADTVER